ncbi:sugar transferase [candidate division KSB1 bacterium]|nr:sugar transferase [candidate division KSB1 bacterium]
MARHFRKFVLLDILSLNLVFFILFFIKKQTVVLTFPYSHLFFIVNASWFIEFIVVNKYVRMDTPFLIDRFYHLFKSSMYVLTLTTLLIVSFHLHGYSRLFVLRLFLAHFFILLGVHTRYYRLVDAKHIFHPLKSHLLDNFDWRKFLQDVFIVPSSFLAVRWFKNDGLQIDPECQQLLVLYTGLWMAFAFWTAKFSKEKAKNIYFELGLEFRVLAYLAVSIAFLIFILGVQEFSRVEMFGPVFFIFVLKSVLIIMKYYYLKKFPHQEDVEAVFDIQSQLRQEELLIPERKFSRATLSVGKYLETKYLKDMPEMYGFLDSFLPLQDIEENESVILDTRNLYNINIQKDLSARLFINLHKVNDVGPVNKYILTVHRKLVAGGYFVGCKSTMSSYRTRFYKKYPRYLANPLYVLDFLIHRVWPKIRGVNAVYYFVFKDRSKIISRAELFGRLTFCGFNVKQSTYIGGSLYFIAQKVKPPSFDTNPSYGPVIKLKRIGLNGKAFDLYKFRTMHPYSEYIQDYVYERNKLDQFGKIKDDFRLTGWGKVMRKYWLDELPQVYNFLRGDISLVGVRALSRHFFQLYPKDVQKLRTRLKPGILPPFYADLPESFDEIVESERKYLQRKLKKPLSTDFVYFFRILKNIVVKRARSH